MSTRLSEVFPFNLLTISGGRPPLNIIQPPSVMRCSLQKGRIRQTVQANKIRRALQGCRQIHVPNRGRLHEIHASSFAGNCGKSLIAPVCCMVC
jgi:hypothetical protein